MNYTMIPIGTGTRLRIDHTTFSEVITSYGVTALVQGEPKSLDIISRSTLKALEHAIKEIDKLRLDVEQIKKKK